MQAFLHCNGHLKPCNELICSLCRNKEKNFRSWITREECYEINNPRKV